MQDLQQCVRCIYDASIPGIGFAADRICSHCRQYEELDRDYPTGAAGHAAIDTTLTRMKKDGEGKPYCLVISVSGGCDSSYMLHFARRELAFRQ